MQEILKGIDCLLRVNIASVGAVQNAVKIDTHLISPSGVSTCISNGYDELAKTVEMIISGDLLNELGAYSIDMRLVFASGAIVVPTFAFAEVVASVDSCDMYSIVNITIQAGEVEPDTPTPTINVVGREEFEVLSAEVRTAIVDAEKATKDAIESSKGATDATSSAVLATANADKATSQATVAKENAERATQMATQSATNAEQATLNANTATANANKATEDANKATEDATTAKENAEKATEDVREALAEFNEQRANYAEKDGNYPSMTVGKAENLVGRGEATEEYINFRQSAGNVSIEDGSAKITKIKGNSVVYNQQINNHFTGSGATGWAAKQKNFAREEEGKIVLSRNSQVDIFNNALFQNVEVQNGNKFFISYKYESHNVDQFGRRMYLSFTSKGSTRSGSITDAINARGGGVTGFVSEIGTVNNSNNDITRLDVYFTFASTTQEIDDTPLKIWDFQLVNLTKMFGAGNEPKTVEEYHQRMAVGVDTTVRNTGEILSNKVTAIKSVGENAYDYRKDSEPFRVLAKTYNFEGAYDDLGFTPTKGVRETNIMGVFDKYTFDQEGYLSVSGGDESTCINLKHSYDKPFMHQYQESEIRFDFIKTIKDSEGNLLLPNGLCSVGNVYDEIRYNATTKKWEAVKRVGVRAYVEGDTEDSAVLTDGVNTNYELEDTIIVELDTNFNPTYIVWDFGTEEAIASVPSAPFRADIVYQFNAVDRIRNNSDRIAELEAKVAQLLSAQSTNIINE